LYDAFHVPPTNHLANWSSPARTLSRARTSQEHSPAWRGRTLLHHLPASRKTFGSKIMAPRLKSSATWERPTLWETTDRVDFCARRPPPPLRTTVARAGSGLPGASRLQPRGGGGTTRSRRARRAALRVSNCGRVYHSREQQVPAATIPRYPRLWVSRETIVSNGSGARGLGLELGAVSSAPEDQHSVVAEAGRSTRSAPCDPASGPAPPRDRPTWARAS